MGKEERGMRRALKAAAVGGGALVCGGSAYVALDPGLRREAQFWKLAGPLVASYWAVKYQVADVPIILHLAFGHEMTPADHQAADVRYEELHRQYAPEALSVILELRGLFVKFGQVCSTRPELVPEPYREAFTQLQSEVPGQPVEAIRQVIEAELGPIDALFSEIDPEPCGSASIGQVHRAVTVGGDEVVVKVQYPGISDTFRADLHCIETIVWLARPASIPSFGEFAKQIREELDYHTERQNLEEIHDLVTPVFADVVAVPVARPALCSASVLTMSFLPGQSLQQVATAQMDAAGIQIPKGRTGIKEWIKDQDANQKSEVDKHKKWSIVLRLVGPDTILGVWSAFERCRQMLLWTTVRLVQAVKQHCNITVCSQNWLTQKQKLLAANEAVGSATDWVDTLLTVTGHEMFCGGGLFQADPHPGNVLVMPDGRLGLIDYGQCKRLSIEARQRLARLILSVADQASDEEVADAFRDVGMVTEKNDTRFIAANGRLIFGSVTSQTLDNAWHKELRKRDSIVTFPADLVMVLRTVGILRGFGLMLKCNVNVAEHWRLSAKSVLSNSESLCK